MANWIPILIVVMGVCGMLWFVLNKARHSRIYIWFWIPGVLFLTAIPMVTFINAQLIGSGTAGNGWDAYGAALFFFYSLPLLVLDFVLLLAWPRKKKA
jgi:hypothetical protein